jgi:peptidylprolyl isomerase
MAAVVQTEDLCGDGGLLKRILKAGSGAVPRIGARVKIRYAGSLAESGERFDAALAEFHLGESQVIAGWDKGVATMRKAEVADLVCRADYAFGAHGKPPGVPPHALVKYEVELLSFHDPERERWELSAAEQLEGALRLKASGAEAVQATEWATARAHYREAAGLLEGFAAPEMLFTEREAAEQQAQAALLACRLNEAMVSLKLDDARGAEVASTAALALDAASVKGLFRRGAARTQLADFRGARQDLKEACRLDPSSREIRAAWEACQAREASTNPSPNPNPEPEPEP